MIARADGRRQDFERFGCVPGAAARCTNATDLRVLIVLATFANGNRKAWPGIENICKTMGIAFDATGRRRVKRSLRRLESQGLIMAVTRGGGRGHAGVYRVNGVPIKGDTGDHRLDRKGDIPDPERVAPGVLKGDTGGHPNRVTEKEQSASLAATPHGAARAAVPEAEAERGEPWNPSGAELDDAFVRATGTTRKARWN